MSILKKTLLDVIFASEKRKNTLLLLQDGPKEMEFLLNPLDTTRQALLPQIRILEDHYLITHSHDVYELTTIGKLIVDYMEPIIDKIGVFDTDIDYWGTHYLDFVPSHLLKRIDELGQCTLIKPHITELYEINKEFHEATKKSKSHYIVTTFLHPNFPELTAELTGANVEIYFITSQVLFDKLLEEKYDEFSSMLSNKLIHVFVSPREMDFQFISVNDYYIIMALLKTGKEVDLSYLLCSSEKSLKWGKDFFDFYLKDSTLITEI
ncbi:helix-turn-helix transcriptional regulator [Methanolobus sp.]|uniref:helix-turn-helix transcriptional regulator n=1 Tax=Methanolobus sp. TaxID=1874737 RepID=UPI003522E203